MIRQYLIEEDGELVVNKKQCYLIPEFKVLFDRDKGSKIDPRGRHQLVACGEMKYIYYFYDPRSEYYNTPKSLSNDIVMDISGLPDNWKEDKELDKAIQVYKRLQTLSSAGSAYFAADSALFERGQDVMELSEVIREMKIELRTALKIRSKRTKEYTAEELEITTNLLNKITNIIKIQNDIDNVINRMPKLTATIKDLREQYAQEDNENNTVVGGGQLGPREA